MKKIIFIIFLIIGIIIGYKGLTFTNDKLPQSIKENQVDKQINTIQKELDQYKQKEQEEKIRRLRIQQLQNPEIINKELAKTGELIIFTGITTYNDNIKESNWYSSKSLDINYVFNFGISIDLNDIKINKFIEDSVIIDIPSSRLHIQYVELDTSKSKLLSSKTVLSKQFTPEDINIINQNSQKDITNKINNSKDIFDQSLTSLKDNLKELISKLGYKNIVFNEI